MRRCVHSYVQSAPLQPDPAEPARSAVDADGISSCGSRSAKRRKIETVCIAVGRGKKNARGKMGSEATMKVASIKSFFC